MKRGKRTHRGAKKGSPHYWKPPPCSTGKASFKTRGRALAALREIERIEVQAAAPSPTAPNDQERCEECGAYHLVRRV